MIHRNESHVPNGFIQSPTADEILNQFCQALLVLMNEELWPS
jgi:hypothetical protein